MTSHRFIALADGGVFDSKSNRILRRADADWNSIYLDALSKGESVAPPVSLPADSSIDELRDTIKSQIKDHATSLRNLYTRGESQSEVAGWYTKASEARAVETQSASTFATLKKYAPTLCAEIDAEGYSNDATRVAALRELARSVLDNHEPYLVFLMAVQAQSKHHRDALDAADPFGDGRVMLDNLTAVEVAILAKNGAHNTPIMIRRLANEATEIWRENVNAAHVSPNHEREKP
ncbi:MAG: hypothetical protein LBB65_08650 [Burkholderiales bacterium]|jgi:hypothetical protein|nr:hypothetical protein [Burkholderiales bacterium]